LDFGARCYGRLGSPSVKPIWQFQGVTVDPQGLLRHDGKLYGVASHAWGEVFQLTPQADGSWSKSSYSIQPETDGRYLTSSLAFDDHGMLYATTQQEGYYRTPPCGTVLQLKPPAAPGGAWGHSVIYRFQRHRGCPIGTLTYHNGNLYGSTFGDGANAGTVFELAPPSASKGDWKLITLYTFTGDNGSGAGPIIVSANGVIYGGTYWGGSSDHGTVYSLTPPSKAGDAWTANIYSFPGGSYGALGNLTLGPDGALYGSSGIGLYRVLPPAGTGGEWTESTVYTFTVGPGGGVNKALVIKGDGTIYGTTSDGLPTCYCGTLFQLTPVAGGWEETVLHQFTPPDDGYGNLTGMIADSDGGLLVTTDSAQWSIVKFTPPSGSGSPWTETLVYSFGPGGDGGRPSGSLVFDTQGNAYGTTCSGGYWDYGAVFKLTPTTAPSQGWSESLLYNFKYLGDAYCPSAGVLIDRNGVLYGTANVDLIHPMEISQYSS
jgi:uncharacterized repeat protein (TIGR03803 family)